jgi:hypothetical protein
MTRPAFQHAGVASALRHSGTEALVVLVLAFALSASAHASDFFVSPAGSDDVGTGAIDKPFKTIHKGLALAKAGDRVVLRGGEYRLADEGGTLHFPRAGADGQPITLTAHSDEYAAVLGSVRLTDWKPHEGRIYKCPAPSKRVCGLFEDGERLNHPREPLKRENPPVWAVKLPGEWTAADGWIYLFCREGDSPAVHRIEASQMGVIVVDKPWVRVEKLHVFFGQPLGLDLAADHCVAEDVEVAHVSNSVDNAYGAYLSGCSDSALRNSVVHDSFYWGAHSENSHVISTIDCGDRGPNFVENCEAFNGGLGVGSKGAVRELVVRNNLVRDVYWGVRITGERSSGPGAGKKDRGHYLVFNNLFRSTAGVGFWAGTTHGDRIFNNLFDRCPMGIYVRNYMAEPDRPEFANNVFLGCDTGVLLIDGYEGKESAPLFHEAGLRSWNNLYFECKRVWRNPLDWARNLDLTLKQVQAYRDFGWEKNSVDADPMLDERGLPKPGSPVTAKGAALDLPAYMTKPARWDIGLVSGDVGPKREPGLALSIAGSAASATPGEPVTLRATLRNESATKGFATTGDAIVTFYFRAASDLWFDRQELWRVRVQLPDRTLAPGEALDLAALPGWKNPVCGKPGDEFYLRADDRDWRQGRRLSATLRFVKRDVPTVEATQRLEPLILSREILHVDVAARP